MKDDKIYKFVQKYKEEVGKLEVPNSQSVPRLVVAQGSFEEHEIDEVEALAHLNKTEAYLTSV
jgi:hypothetical protein